MFIYSVFIHSITRYNIFFLQTSITPSASDHPSLTPLSKNGLTDDFQSSSINIGDSSQQSTSSKRDKTLDEAAITPINLFDNNNLESSNGKALKKVKLEKND